MSGVERWRAARRVLAVRLDAMGDVLMTTPALRALAAGGRHVTLLTSPAGAAVARLVPGIADVIPFTAPWVKAPSVGELAGADEMIARLRGGGFDAAVVFTVWSQSALPAALLCLLAGIPLRLAHCRENPYRLLTDWVPDPERHGAARHEVRRQLDLVGAVGVTTDDERLRLHVPARLRSRIRFLLRGAGLDARGAWVAMHPGATAPSRRYPPESFADVGRGLARAGLRVAVVGTRDERSLVELVCDGVGPAAVSLAGRTDTAELAALLQEAPLLIANNSGPTHLAAAVGTPVVVLYALTNPQHGPWGVPHRVLSHDVPCRNCLKSVCPEGHHDCLRRVPAAAVVDAALALLRAEAAPMASHGRAAL